MVAAHLTRHEREWLERAQEQLDSFERSMRRRLDAWRAPPTGDRAARAREQRRRARSERGPESYLEGGLHSVALARAALLRDPRSGEAVYGALMVAVFS